MKKTLKETIQLIQSGQPVAIPTDTVYGLAAKVNDDSAIQRIFEVKQRPPEKALIVLISAVQQLEQYVDSISPLAQKLMAKFWPGPLTIVLPVKTGAISNSVRCGGNTVGFRLVDRADLVTLIEAVGPIVAPSANRSGNPTTNSATDVENDLGAAFPVLDLEVTTIGRESTLVVEAEDGWKVLREGAIPAAVILSENEC